MDDDFDDSYEGLLALGQIVGPVKRGCSEGTLDGLPRGTYAEFSAGGSDDNKVLGDNGSCAICLEDYRSTDLCTKLPRCKHFYHKDCVKVSFSASPMILAIDSFSGMAKDGKNLSGLSRECRRSPKSQRQLSSITCSICPNLRGAERTPRPGFAVSQRHEWCRASYHSGPTPTQAPIYQ
jgi:hypothetical protein